MNVNIEGFEEALLAEARRQGLSQQSIIRQALADYLKIEIPMTKYKLSYKLVEKK